MKNAVSNRMTVSLVEAYPLGTASDGIKNQLEQHHRSQQNHRRNLKPEEPAVSAVQLVKLRFVQHAPGKFEPLVRQHFSTPFEQ